MTTGSILGDTWGVYRLLFRRSVAAAAVIYAVIGLAELAADQAGGGGVRVAIGLLSLALGLAGPILVQGALVEIVRNVHDGQPPASVSALYERSQQRFWRLLGASVIYGLGVTFGLLLLIVPGLLAAARWALLAPLIMIERLGVFDALERSRSLVKGHTGAVLGAVILAFLLLSAPGLLLAVEFPGGPAGFTFFSIVWGSLTAPFGAHMLSVVYFRLVDPEQPVINPVVRQWQSVWRGV